jgi:cytochrome c oxidase accessory protein FixG
MSTSASDPKTASNGTNDMAPDIPVFEWEKDESFRDSIGTVREDGKRNWIYAKKPKGRYYNKRKIVSAVLLVLFFVTPFIKVGGNPLFLFNIIERRFILFGIPFWTQDFHLFVLAFLTMVVFVILFSVVFGRVWCGWACPQTVFMEMVFRRIEYWIEGDANKQRKLNAGPWNADKVRKKGLKWSIFALFSFLIGNLALTYIVGVDEWKEMVMAGPAEKPGLFTATMAFSGIFFFVFAYFREQACIVVCPYGRLQGVLLTKESMLVAYDYLRGEPRGRRKKNQSEAEAAKPLGDCVDCKLCVQVCPTGIDIRNGTQMECVNCTACIDACDEVMEKVNRPTGLIRVTSEQQLATGKSFKPSPRVYAYTGVLAIMVTILTFGLTKGRNDVEATILRQSGMLYRELDDGRLNNQYSYQIVNKTMKPMELQIQLQDPTMGELQMIGTQRIQLEAQGVAKGAFLVAMEKDKLNGRMTKVRFEVVNADAETVDLAKSNFLGPIGSY